MTLPKRHTKRKINRRSFDGKGNYQKYEMLGMVGLESNIKVLGMV